MEGFPLPTIIFVGTLLAYKGKGLLTFICGVPYYKLLFLKGEPISSLCKEIAKRTTV